jgi:hypothetical protein
VSAIPTPAPGLAEPRTLAGPRRIAVPAGLVAAARTAAMLGLVLLVPGEAARIGADLHVRRDGP